MIKDGTKMIFFSLTIKAPVFNIVVVDIFCSLMK